MSSSFFEAQHVFESTLPPEIRLYYNEEGVILDKKYVKNEVKDNKLFIVITQEQYDAINLKRHRVIDKELVWITPKKTHWFLTQEELTRNPYVKD